MDRLVLLRIKNLFLLRELHLIARPWSHYPRLPLVLIIKAGWLPMKRVGFHSIVPDTLKSQEYVVGVFMKEQSVKLAEIIILRRINSSSIMIKPVQNDQNTMIIAQSNVNKAVVEGLTRAPKNYNADMNVRLTMLTNQIRNEYKGMLVTPENGFGLSTQGYKTYRVIYGLPVISSGKAAKELITSSECETLLQHFEAVQRALLQPESAPDTIVKKLK